MLMSMKRGDGMREAFHDQLDSIFRDLSAVCGNVQEAVMIRSVHPGYDAELLRAARNWRYVPARKDGKPVKFARVINVLLKKD